MCAVDKKTSKPQQSPSDFYSVADKREKEKVLTPTSPIPSESSIVDSHTAMDIFNRDTPSFLANYYNTYSSLSIYDYWSSFEEHYLIGQALWFDLTDLEDGSVFPAHYINR